MLTVAYVRVSTDDQVEYSPDAQAKRARDFARVHDLGAVLLPAGGEQDRLRRHAVALGGDDLRHRRLGAGRQHPAEPQADAAAELLGIAGRRGDAIRRQRRRPAERGLWFP